MSLGEKVSQSLSTGFAGDSTEVTVGCVCGEETRLSRGLAGRVGACPGCGARLRIPGRSAGKGAAKPSHLMMEFKVALLEPNLAPNGSEYYAAQLQTHVMSLVSLMVWLYLGTQLDPPGPALLRVIGAAGTWPTWALAAWALLAFVATSACAVPVALLFARYSGHTYTEDRTGFARAGGFDIIRWVPILVLAVLAAAVPRLGTSGAASRLHDPWILLAVACVASQLVAAMTAWRVFRARFGPAGQSRL